MVTPTVDIASAARRTREDGQSLRHRLDVVGADTGDVVRTAGGWLFDRVMAGWEVNVLLPRGHDARPLRILGVRVLELESGLDTTGPLSQGLAASVEAVTAHDCVRELVRRALDNPATDVALWGRNWPLGMDRGMTRTEFTISAAARAFKSQTLRAAGSRCGAIEATETLFTDSAWLG